MTLPLADRHIAVLLGGLSSEREVSLVSGRECAEALAVLSKAPPGLTIVQHSVRLTLDESYGKLRRSRVVRQGDNALSFYVEQSP